MVGNKILLMIIFVDFFPFCQLEFDLVFDCHFNLRIGIWKIQPEIKHNHWYCYTIGNKNQGRYFSKNI